jgi:hypothetical protein
MQKLTLSFLNCKSPIPIVCFPLSDGKNIYAIIDTGSDSTVYDKNAKDNYPEMFLKTKHIGKHQVVGVLDKDGIWLSSPGSMGRCKLDHL